MSPLAAWLPALLLAADAQPLRAADVALDGAVAARDRAAFAALLAPDTYWCSGGGALAGPEAVLEDWSVFFQPGGPALRWAPDRAEVAASGDLGFTVGNWTLDTRDAQGNPVHRAGRYVTVWTRGADGAYRVAADAGLRPVTDAGTVRQPARRATAASGELRFEAGRYTRADGAERGGYLEVIRRVGDEDEVLVSTQVPSPPGK